MIKELKYTLIGALVVLACITILWLSFVALDYAFAYPAALTILSLMLLLLLGYFVGFLLRSFLDGGVKAVKRRAP